MAIRVPHLALKMEGSPNTDLGCYVDSCFLAHLEMQDEDAGISVGLVRSEKSQIGPITLRCSASYGEGSALLRFDAGSAWPFSFNLMQNLLGGRRLVSRSD